MPKTADKPAQGLHTETVEVQGQSYTLTEPTGRTMIQIEKLSDQDLTRVELMAHTIALLLIEPADLSGDQLLDGPFAVLEGLAVGLERFQFLAEPAA